jgi:hypothetical protein
MTKPDDFKQPTVDTKSPRDKYREEYADITKRLFQDDTTEEDQDTYDQARFDVYSMDTDRAMACFEEFAGSGDLLIISQIVQYTKNDAIRLELAKIVDVTSSIQHMIDHPDTRYSEKIYQLIIKIQIDMCRANIKTMIEYSNGEAKKLFEQKLTEFNNAFSAVESKE